MMLLSSTGNMNVCAATRTCKCFTPNKRISDREHCPLMGRHMSVTASNPADSLAVCSWDCSSQQRAMPSWCQCFRYMFVNDRGHDLLQKRRLTAVAPHIIRNLLLATEVVWVSQIISHSRSTVGDQMHLCTSYAFWNWFTAFLHGNHHHNDFQNEISASYINKAAHGPLAKYELEIVDQWSTRIPPPHRRGWQWAMGGLQLNIVQNHKAAILKAT